MREGKNVDDDEAELVVSIACAVCAFLVTIAIIMSRVDANRATDEYIAIFETDRQGGPISPPQTEGQCIRKDEVLRALIVANAFLEKQVSHCRGVNRGRFNCYSW